MTILPGHRLGPYEILVSIGAGGMGEVYKAHDTRLNRDVAAKVLPESLAQEAERGINVVQTSDTSTHAYSFLQELPHLQLVEELK